MVSVCFYFQVHQPYRLKPFQIFDIGNRKSYFDEEKNKQVLLKVAQKCYLPANQAILELLKKHPEMKVSFSFSGVVLDQFEEYCPEALASFQELIKTGQVEVLAETYYHSLSFLYSEQEFVQQVQKHEQKIKKLFGVKPKVLRNTELIYNNALAEKAAEMGYDAVLLEGADKILGWRSPNFVYQPIKGKINLLLKNYTLSDDIAFRFSNQNWKEHPLTAEKYTQWINSINGDGQTVNLFMDYETFGEHQWESTGIFEFLKKLPEELLKHPDNSFKFPSEVAASYSSVGKLDVPDFVSWADLERDVSAWLGNEMQRSAIGKLYAIEKEIMENGDEQIISDWRKLQTSDHFYYMCTKWFSDGDVHKYFNPYDSPYDAFINFMNIYKDLVYRIDKKEEGMIEVAEPLLKNEVRP
ncbi:MAG: glycoside hydrolase family 57 protein [Candidatus Woesearchaeota archaeon]